MALAAMGIDASNKSHSAVVVLWCFGRKAPERRPPPDPTLPTKQPRSQLGACTALTTSKQSDQTAGACHGFWAAFLGSSSTGRSLPRPSPPAFRLSSNLLSNHRPATLTSPANTPGVSIPARYLLLGA
jgi:hypothetical protein